MDKYGMIQVIANWIVDGLQSAPAVYTLLMPVIGTLGSGLTGSTTTSNFLFGRLQVTTAKNLGLVTPGRNTVYEIAGTVQVGSVVYTAPGCVDTVVLLFRYAQPPMCSARRQARSLHQ